MAVTKSGMGTLGLGCGTGMQGCRDAGTPACGTRARVGTQEHGTGGHD